ncbi:uncharacterized protein LOC115889859 [Sitophilus oryzae]|uniref:Uncharacterized protein LOC115889859 n=1 Tax=Sitophilus oryzae TaxID=7048 RepID=A0A6J2YR60_SITOR|nr:uncharacterized protein LOC115889859 [Sitophilus oryzae]
MEVNILGVSEVHWPGTGMIKSKGKVFYYSGNDSIDQNHQRGVGILIDENLQKSVKNFIPLSERVILIQLLGRPININIIQVYAPTAEKAEDEIEDFYRQLDQVLRLTKSNEINLVLGDFNAKVGKGRLGSVVGNYGLGERNDTDYILINNRFPLNPLRANILLRFAKPKRKSLRKNLDPKLLRDQQTRSMYENHINRELESIVSTNDIEKHWLGIKQAFKNTNENLLTANRTTAKNEWMSEDILKMMEQRRQFKIQNNHNEYKSMQRKIRNKIRTAKERCIEAENLSHLGDNFHLHKKVKEIAGLHHNKSITLIKTDENKIITETEELLQTWRNYTINLFNDERSENPATEIPMPSGPSILESEIIHAIRLMKTTKLRPDDMYSETFHLINEQNLKTIVQLFNNIYDTGYIPEDWLRSTFITLPKSSNATSCKEYRLISLMSHFLKLFLRVLHTRLYKICEEVSGESQFGFKNGFGTREAIFSLQTLVQNCQDQRKDVFMCFIDYEKTFDNVKHNLLVSYLRNLGLDGKDIRLISNLYWNQKAEIRIHSVGVTEDFEIKKGNKIWKLSIPIQG